MKLKTLEDLRIEEELCEKLDTDVYLPTKKELEGKVNGTYSLGFRKEDFKGTIAKKMNELRQSVIEELKEAIKSRKAGFVQGIWDGKKISFTDDVIGYLKWKFNIRGEELK